MLAATEKAANPTKRPLNFNCTGIKIFDTRMIRTCAPARLKGNIFLMNDVSQISFVSRALLVVHVSFSVSAAHSLGDG